MNPQQNEPYQQNQPMMPQGQTMPQQFQQMVPEQMMPEQGQVMVSQNYASAQQGQQMMNQDQGIIPGQEQMMAPGQMMPEQMVSQEQLMPQQFQQMAPEQMMPGQGQPMMPEQGQPIMQGQTQQMMPEQMMPQEQTGQSNPQVILPNQSSLLSNGKNLSASNMGAAAIAAKQKSPVSPNVDVPTSTQSTLLISELRDNVVIMKDGSFRAVVACKSINFDLMSEMEREGVEYSYQNFLNSLKFTIQILVRSQKVDIGPYLERLVEIRKNNDNMLLGVLMDDYINFIDVLSQEANIMDKSFFVVIPYYTSAEAEKALEQTKNFFKSFSKSKAPVVSRIDRATYDKALSELSNRVDSVTSGLFQIGIHSVRLNTRELAELYYNFNNPDTAVREPLVDFSRLATMYVKKGDKKEEWNE